MKTRFNGQRAKTLALISLIFPLGLFAQSGGVAVNNTGGNPDPSAMLDVSSTEKGILIPRMTEAERNAINDPALGLQIYNTTTNCLNIWMGMAWKKICGECDFPSVLVADDSGPICQGSDLSLTVTPVSGATYAWTGPNGFTSSDQNPTITNATYINAGEYSVIVTLGGCSSSPVTTEAVVHNGPPVMTTSLSGPDDNLGGNTSADFYALPVDDATSFVWSLPDGASIVLGQGTTHIEASFGCSANGIVTVTPANACGSGPATNLAVSTDILPVITGPQIVSRNSSGNVYTVTTNPVYSYSWTVPAGATINSGQGTSSISVSFGNSSGTGDVEVDITSPCGSSTATLGVSIGQITFGYTGEPATFTVPSGVTALSIEARGAQGGNYPSTGWGGNFGGLGGLVEADFTVTPGTVFTIYVGGHPTGSDAGYNGGGYGAGLGTGGGGGSDVRAGGTDLSDRIIVAGGGGGVCTFWPSSGGLGGGTNGTDGYTADGPPRDGRGATQSAGGEGDIQYDSGGDGTLGQGGNAGWVNNNGGGGGGGYYGGGGGAGGAGGGGSGWVTSSGTSNVVYDDGANSGNGSVTISW